MTKSTLAFDSIVLKFSKKETTVEYCIHGDPVLVQQTGRLAYGDTLELKGLKMFMDVDINPS